MMRGWTDIGLKNVRTIQNVSFLGLYITVQMEEVLVEQRARRTASYACE